jgi:hypothetical protein
VLCQRALADIGTRSSITSVFPGDGSNESALCGLYYDGLMLHLLRAANWNFATRSNLLTLWKALPGTPENQSAATVSGWSPAYPAPPWTYSYVYPADCVRMRKMIGQPQQVPIAPPIFSGSTGTNPPISQRLPMARFEIASDMNDANGVAILGLGTTVAPSIISGGSGYVLGEAVTLAGGTLSLGSSYAPQPAQPGVVGVTGIGTGGVVTAVQPVILGAYTVPPNPANQASSSGAGTGLVLAPAWSPVAQQVVLTQQEFALAEYTFWNNPESIMDDLFAEAFISAMAGRLAQSLTGDKALARDKYTIANSLIVNARVADGNEGLTINDHIPDWIRTRGVGGGLGYETFLYPLGPLFPVAPLI